MNHRHQSMQSAIDEQLRALDETLERRIETARANYYNAPTPQRREQHRREWERLEARRRELTGR